jgi:hypothetical protein
MNHSRKPTEQHPRLILYKKLGYAKDFAQLVKTAILILKHLY